VVADLSYSELPDFACQAPSNVPLALAFCARIKRSRVLLSREDLTFVGFPSSATNDALRP
jgi:hypothetical protein